MTDNTSDISNVLEDDNFWKTMGGEADSVVPKDKLEDKLEKSISVSDPVAASARFSPNDIPKIKNIVSIPVEYQETVDRVSYSYEMLPKLEYNKIYSEIKNNLTVMSEPTPDAQSINQLLERIQAAKDRLGVIQSEVLQSYNFKKRAVDILRDTWCRFSTAKSADYRKSEAENIIVNFEIDLAYTENLFKTCVHVAGNLDGLHDNVSRRITIMQVCLKYNDIGRGMLPDFSFKTFSGNLNNEEKQNKLSIDPNVGIEAEEKDFCVK